VGNIYRELGARHGQTFDIKEVILAAAAAMRSPHFLFVAVIIAGLPSHLRDYTGPGIGLLFRPMAKHHGVALIGSLILTLTLVPVLAATFLKGVKDKPVASFDWIRNIYGALLRGACAIRHSRSSPRF